MPVCRQCGKQWPDDFAVCPDDGMRMSVIGAFDGALAYAQVHASEEDLPAGSHAGEYVIEKKLGEGGMGAVYGARHPVIGKRAAIKVIKRELSASAEGVDRFVLEAQSVNTIGHPNIVDVFGFGTLSDGRSFFVMEWLEGESLRDRMTRPLAFSQALEVLESIATALQAAHEAGVVHRDLKPDNVFLARVRGSQAPRVKLLDFGLAKLSGNSNERGLGHTRTGIVMGTPLYLSPEQAKGAKIDAATDVYSLGAMAYEMAAGQVPFLADSAVEIMAMHISAQPDRLNERAPWVPPVFQMLVHRMLEKDARARPTSAEVVQQLTMMRTQPEIANASPVPGSAAAQWTPAPPGMSSPMRTHPGGMPQLASSPHAAVTLRPTAHPTMPPRNSRGLILGIVAALVIAGGAAAYFVLGIGDKHVKVAASEPVKTEPMKAEPVRAEPVKTEAPKTEPPKTESAKTEAGSGEAGSEPVKTEPPKTEPPKTEPPKTEPAKHVMQKLGTVVVTVNGAPRGTVWIDGQQVATEVAQAEFELSAGNHKIRVQAPGHKPFVSTVQVEPGVKKPVAVQLKRQSINTVHDPFAD